jgi:hypothetical protein
MNQCIIYKKDEGGIAVIYPTEEALSVYGIQAIALKDVPEGKSFKIIDIQDLPDRSTRNYWDVDVNLLTDGIGAESNNFPENGGL